MFYEASGNYRTDSLFRERMNARHRENGHKPMYSLSERRVYKDCPKLYDLFIESVDEYDFAAKALGGKAHLDKLKSVKWFMDGWTGCSAFRGFSAWQDDMAERDRSLGKRIIIEKARDGDVSAAKKLVDMNKPSTNTKGRPKKEDIVREAGKRADEIAGVEDDMKRLNVIKLRG